MEQFRRIVVGLKERWRLAGDPAAAEVLKKYREKGGIFLGAEEEPYRFKVTPDRIEFIRLNPEQPVTDPEAEKERVANWAYGYTDIAFFTQRYLRVALGLPADIPQTPESPEAK